MPRVLERPANPAYLCSDSLNHLRFKVKLSSGHTEPLDLLAGRQHSAMTAYDFSGSVPLLMVRCG
jgi:hypothetical protein